MLLHYSKNIFKRAGGVIYYNFKSILIFLFIGSGVFVINKVFNIEEASLPVVPVTILGGALAIFLAFRNNAAYDRWWEARKVWGSIVNSSRTFGTEIMTFLNLRHAQDDVDKNDLKGLQQRMVYRHIAYVNALRMTLRETYQWEELKGFLKDEEYEKMLTAPNKATCLNHFQGIDLEWAMEQGLVEDFRHMLLMNEIKDFYVHQGKCERIKKTVFPFYYTYFTGLFLWLFILLLPFALVGTMGYGSIPLSVAISFVFYILDQSGMDTEDPFENRAADTPISAICRNIEIDMKFQLGESDLPQTS